MREELRIRTSTHPVGLYRVHYERRSVLVLPRHGPTHACAPHEIGHGSHMEALRSLGVTAIVGLSAVGALRADLPVAATVIPDDFVGARELPSVDGYRRTAHGPVHQSFAEAYCPQVRRILVSKFAPGPCVYTAGIYLQAAGPRYETPAEVRLYRQWGADIVGMTGVSEVVAARQSGLCYAALACVTNLGTGLSRDEPQHGRVSEIMSRFLVENRDAILTAALEAGDLPPCSSCCR